MKVIPVDGEDEEDELKEEGEEDELKEEDEEDEPKEEDEEDELREEDEEDEPKEKDNETKEDGLDEDELEEEDEGDRREEYGEPKESEDESNTVSSQQGVQTEEEEEVEIFNLEDELFVPGREKARQTRRQKRQDRYRHGQMRQATHELDISAKEFRKLQKEDPTLSKLWEIVKGQETEGLFVKEGLLYRK